MSSTRQNSMQLKRQNSIPQSVRLIEEGLAEDTQTFKMVGNLYSNALIAQLGLPGLDDQKGSVWNWPRKWLPLFVMILVTVFQLTMSWAVYLHVYNNMIFSNTRPLLTAYEMFVGSNITIPLHTAEALCGEWEDHEMKDFAQGPLSFVKTPDGSVFKPDETYSFFYNVKQPTRTWDYAALGTHRSVLDDSLFVISEGVTLNPFTPSGYSLLFILSLCLFYQALFIELRRTWQWALMLVHFHRKGEGPAYKQDSAGAWQISHVSTGGQVAGWIAVQCRLIVAIVLLMLVSQFLLHTTLKIDLILNGLALTFLLELNEMVYLAAVPSFRQRFIKELDPVEYRDRDQPPAISRYSKEIRMAPILIFPVSFLSACLMRAYQLKVFQKYFRLSAAICLFAGPTTPFARHDIVHPVAGFCDSLLGAKCAPHVEPLYTLQEHGHCIVTDKTVTNSATFSYYLDSPTLYANRYSEDGTMKSWVDWGDANPQLYKSGLWMDGPYQEVLRKNCLQMYQKTVKPDDVLVDDDAGETMDGAPFQCPRETLFNAVFGKVFDSLDKMPIHRLIDQVADLTDPAVIQAIDECNKESQPKKTTVALPAAASSPPAKAKELTIAVPPALPASASKHMINAVNSGASSQHRQRHHLRHGRHDHELPRIVPHT